MRWTFALLLTLLTPLFSNGQTEVTQDPSQKPKLSNEDIDNHLGKNWKGIIYICNPYCEFVAVREENAWNPAVDKHDADWEHTKTVAQTDPLYPLLISRLPVLPFINKNLQQAKKEEDKSVEKPPKYAVYNFNWGYAIALGFLYSQSQWTGNTQLQTDLSSQEIGYTPFLQLQLMRGKPSKIGKNWVQHEVDLTYGTSPGYKSQDPDISVTNSQYNISYQAWFTYPKFKVGPRLAYDDESWTTSTNSLQHFSFERQSYLLGAYGLWNHWMIAFDMSLLSKISEQQQFRKDPFTLNWYRLKIQKCSRDMSLFDINFGLCGGGMVLLDQQKAALADNILLSETSTLNRTDYGVYFSIRIGEDLY